MKCGKRVMLNSVMCAKCDKWMHGKCAKMKRVTSTQGYLELRDAKLNFACDNGRAIVLKQIYTTNIRLGLC